MRQGGQTLATTKEFHDYVVGNLQRVGDVTTRKNADGDRGGRGERGADGGNLTGDVQGTAGAQEEGEESLEIFNRHKLPGHGILAV